MIWNADSRRETRVKSVTICGETFPIPNWDYVEKGAVAWGEGEARQWVQECMAQPV
jgi:hypothetical protein